MEYTNQDVAVVFALATVLVAWMFFKHKERQRRLEIVHIERLAAMDKGIPLPELPADRPAIGRIGDPRMTLIHGIVWTALALGAVVALFIIPNGIPFWPLPLPLLFLGVGLILFYVIVRKRSR